MVVGQLPWIIPLQNSHMSRPVVPKEGGSCAHCTTPSSTLLVLPPSFHLPSHSLSFLFACLLLLGKSVPFFPLSPHSDGGGQLVGRKLLRLFATLTRNEHGPVTAAGGSQLYQTDRNGVVSELHACGILKYLPSSSSTILCYPRVSFSLEWLHAFFSGCQIKIDIQHQVAKLAGGSVPVFFKSVCLSCF